MQITVEISTYANNTLFELPQNKKEKLLFIKQFGPASKNEKQIVFN